MSFSQTINQKTKYPKKVIIGRDTVLAIKFDQAKGIAGDLTEFQYNDSMINDCQESIKLANETIKERDTVLEIKNKEISEYKVVISRDSSIMSDKDKIIELKDKETKSLKRSLIKQKILKNIAFVACVAIPVVLIYFHIY